MISVYLVIYLSLAPTKGPIVLEPVPDMETCMVKAETINRVDGLGLKKDARLVAAGAEVACIRVIRDSV